MKSNEIERNQTQFDDIKLNQLKLYQIKLNYIKLDDMKWDEIKLTTFGAEKKNWGINQKMRTVEYNSHWFHPGEWSNQTKHVTIRTQPINHSIKTTTIRKKKKLRFLDFFFFERKKKVRPEKESTTRKCLLMRLSNAPAAMQLQRPAECGTTALTCSSIPATCSALSQPSNLLHHPQKAVKTTLKPSPLGARSVPARSRSQRPQLPGGGCLSPPSTFRHSSLDAVNASH